MTGLTLIQARLGSVRFPRKVLQDLAGQPVIRWVVSRALAIGWPVVVACPLADLGEIREAASGPKDKHLRIVGSGVRAESDVLARLADVVQDSTADFILRITADSPFLDPFLGRQLSEAWLAEVRFNGDALDYLAPCYPPPLCEDGGLDIEACSREAILTANREASDPRDREHPTRFLWSNPDRFACRKFPEPQGYGKLGLRWMIDTPEDLDRLRPVAAGLQGSFADSRFARWEFTLDRETREAGRV